MAYLNFTGKDSGSLTRALKRKSGLGVPYIAVILSALPSLFALMTASKDPNTTANQASPRFM